MDGIQLSSNDRHFDIGLVMATGGLYRHSVGIAFYRLIRKPDKARIYRFSNPANDQSRVIKTVLNRKYSTLKPIRYSLSLRVKPEKMFYPIRIQFRRVRDFTLIRGTHLVVAIQKTGFHAGLECAIPGGVSS